MKPPGYETRWVNHVTAKKLGNSIPKSAVSAILALEHTTQTVRTMTDNGDTIMAGALGVLGNALQAPTGGLRNKGIILASHARPTDEIVVRMAKRLKPEFITRAKTATPEYRLEVAGTAPKRARLSFTAEKLTQPIAIPLMQQLQDIKVGKTKYKYNGSNYSTDDYQESKRRTTTSRFRRRATYTPRKSYRRVRPQAKTYSRRWPAARGRTWGGRGASRPYARTARTYGRWTYGTVRRSRPYSSRRRRTYY